MFNHYISHTSIYHTYYKYYIQQNIYIFIISMLLNRCQTLIQKPFSWKAWTFITKTLLLEGTKILYQSPLTKHNYFLQKSFS